MKLSRADVTPLALVLVGGLTSLALTGPHRFAFADDDPAVRESIVRAVVAEQLDGAERVLGVEEVVGSEEIVVAERGRVQEGVRLESRVVIRGAPTAEGPEPLIYVDGVRLEGDRHDLDLDPETIDRVEVLRGAAALELYGEGAAGGVIRILTKKAEVAGEPGA